MYLFVKVVLAGRSRSPKNADGWPIRSCCSRKSTILATFDMSSGSEPGFARVRTIALASCHNHAHLDRSTSASHIPLDFQIPCPIKKIDSSAYIQHS